MKELKNRIVTVRVSPSDYEDLEKLAAVLEEDPTATARRAIKALIRHAKNNGWKVTLPAELGSEEEPKRIKRAA